MALPIFIGEKMAKHILSCSFGKDSIATALLALQHGEPLDELVYCEVMFSEEISGELPEHNRFIHETAIPYFEQRGIPTRVLRSEKTYLSCFYHVVTRGKTKGMVSLPAEMQTAIENVGFLASIPLWLVTILGSLFITVLSFVMILTVYGRFFRLYMYTALAPLPLAAFAGESTQSVGISFLKSYVGVCLEGAVIVLACVIYSAFVSTPTVTSGEATTIVWSFLAETVFNMLVLVGLIKGSDRIIHPLSYRCHLYR